MNDITIIFRIIQTKTKIDRIKWKSWLQTINVSITDYISAYIVHALFIINNYYNGIEYNSIIVLLFMVQTTNRQYFELTSNILKVSLRNKDNS